MSICTFFKNDKPVNLGAGNWENFGATSKLAFKRKENFVIAILGIVLILFAVFEIL